MDADAGNNRRRIIAFLGGLDLCDGRYDTPHHPIFRTLQTLHSDDYHNPTYAVILILLFCGNATFINYVISEFRNRSTFSFHYLQCVLVIKNDLLL